MELKDIRKEIDGINDEILRLFLRRMELSEQAAEEKQRLGLAVLDCAREREILASVQEKAGDNGKYAYYLFSRIMNLSRARQSEIMCSSSGYIDSSIAEILAGEDELFPQSGTVACQGVEGSNAQEACDKLIPRGNIMYVRSFEAVFDAVESGLCSFGVLPIENGTNGSVRAVYELLQKKKCHIVRSTTLHIRHELLAKPGTRLEDIRVIYSHEQAIGQCSRYLGTLGDVRLVPSENTAAAAKMVSESEDRCIAAVASPRCSQLYGLKTLKSDIQDSENNYTRFICIAKEPVLYAGANRMSIILSCENRPGSLNDILSILSANGVNMSKLESCPIPGSDFEFMFFLELDTGLREPGAAAMLEELRRASRDLIFLGSYAAV